MSILRTNINGILIETCHYPVPDIFRTKNFKDVIHIDPPDAKYSDEEFETFLSIYRIIDIDEFISNVSIYLKTQGTNNEIDNISK